MVATYGVTVFRTATEINSPERTSIVASSIIFILFFRFHTFACKKTPRWGKRFVLEAGAKEGVHKMVWHDPYINRAILVTNKNLVLRSVPDADLLDRRDSV